MEVPVTTHSNADVYEPVPDSTSATVTGAPERACVDAVLPATGAAGAVDVAVAGFVSPPVIVNAAVSPARPLTHTFCNCSWFCVRVFVYVQVTGEFGIGNAPSVSPATSVEAPVTTHSNADVYGLRPDSTSATVTGAPERACVDAVLPATGAAGAVDVAVAGFVSPPVIVNAAVSPARPLTHTFCNCSWFCVRVFVYVHTTAAFGIVN